MNRQKTLKQGSIFGEVAIITQNHRTATIRSKYYCTLAKINADVFKNICYDNEGFYKKLKENMKYYNDPWKKFMKKLLKQNSYFQFLGTSILDELQYRFIYKQYTKQDTILKTGEKVNQIYFISEGSVQVLLKSREFEYCLTRLTKGGIFGFWHCLASSESSVTIKATDNTTIQTLSFATLQSKRDEFPELHDQLNKAERWLRENKGVPVCDF